MKDTISYYWTLIRDSSPEAKRGVFVIFVALALIITPFSISHHYNQIATTDQIKAKNNYNEAKQLNAKAQQKVKTAKYRLKNQAQMQKDIEKHMDDFQKAELTLMQYKTKHNNITPDQAAAAQDTISKMVPNTHILNDPDNYLIAPIGRTNGLTMNISYSPSFSVYQDHIDVIIHLIGKMDRGTKPVYIVKGLYNIKNNQFDDFNYYTTKYAVNFYNGQDQSVNDQHMTLKQQIAQERKIQEAKEKAEKAKLAKEKAAKEAAEKAKKAKEKTKKDKEAKKNKNKQAQKQDKKNAKKGNKK